MLSANQDAEILYVYYKHSNSARRTDLLQMLQLSLLAKKFAHQKKYPKIKLLKIISLRNYVYGSESNFLSIVYIEVELSSRFFFGKGSKTQY